MLTASTLLRFIPNTRSVWARALLVYQRRRRRRRKYEFRGVRVGRSFWQRRAITTLPDVTIKQKESMHPFATRRLFGAAAAVKTQVSTGDRSYVCVFVRVLLCVCVCVSVRASHSHSSRKIVVYAENPCWSVSLSGRSLSTRVHHTAHKAHRSLV